MGIPKKEHWSKEQIDYLMAHLYKDTIPNIAQHLNRSENAVRLFLYRRRIPVHREIRENLTRKLLDIKMSNSDYFHPTRAFFKSVGITQKRWARIYFGYDQATEAELLAVSKHLQLNTEELFSLLEARQLTLNI